MTLSLRPVVLLAVLLLAHCSKSTPAPPATPPPAAAAAHEGAPAAAGIDWQKGDVDAAFASAKSTNKPLFLYWGAVWCPPCNQVKATIFTRPDFIARSRGLVAVYLDGDTPSAQKLGARFHVVGYPTMVVFKPDGTEVTRLPGEIDAQRYLQVLDLGLNAERGVKDTLAAALAGQSLTPAEWRLLAYYSWDTDEAAVLPAKDVAPTLQRLAAACPAELGDLRTRLGLKAIAAAATADDKPKPGSAPAAARDLLMGVVNDPKAARENLDILVNYPAEIAGYATLPGSAERTALVDGMDKDFDAFAADASVSTTDQVGAVAAKIALVRVDEPKALVPGPLLDQLRAMVARADHDAVSPYQRQTVIAACGDALFQAGLVKDSNALYEAELTRSHQPYYFMLHLAGNAKAQGEKSVALDWYARAYAAAEGPATRLQWGVTYLAALVDLAPEEDAQIGKTARAILDEVHVAPETFYGRNLRSLRKMGKKLVEWDAQAKHKETFADLQARVATLCGKLPADAPERTSCDTIISGAETGLTT